MDIKELKAQAYDAIRQIEMWQARLIQIEKQIAAIKNEKENILVDNGQHTE